jgi:hypothetical protein
MNSNCYPHFLNLQPPEPQVLNSFFPELPKEFPPYYVCQFNRQNNINNNIDNRKETFIRNQQQVPRGDNLGYEISPSNTWEVKQAPQESFNEFNVSDSMTPDLVNLGGRGDVFYGYARNIDVESELKRINFLDDKCFDNRFKIDPTKPTTPLYYHRDMIVKDYIKAQDGTYRGYQTKPLQCLDLNEKINNHVVKPYPEFNENMFHVGPGFNNIKEECYPKEQAFNNFTKRRTIYTRNKFETNPEKYM